MQTVRSPAVAGFFYPGKRSVLEQNGARADAGRPRLRADVP